MPYNAVLDLLPPIEKPELEFRKYFNFLLSLRTRRSFDIALATKPFDITVDPTTFCQLHCPYCSTGNDTIKRVKGTLSSTFHRQTLEPLFRELFMIEYFSTGEPLLNKEFTELVEQTKPHEIFSAISTNLSLPITTDKIDALLQCGLGIISVSLDGACQETHSRYRVGGDFDLVSHNIRQLLERKQVLGLTYPIIQWRFLLFEHNVDEVPEAIRLANEWGVDTLEFFIGSAPTNAVPNTVNRYEGPYPQNTYRSQMHENAKKRVDTPMRRFFTENPGWRPTDPFDVPRVKKCDWLYFATMIYPNGSVGPCCVTTDDTDDFGQLAEDIPFMDVWNNPKYREARTFFAEDTPTGLICPRCPLPLARHNQFRNTLQAILRNAPPWVLKILSSNPDAFFFPIDRRLGEGEQQYDVREVNVLYTDHFPNQFGRFDEATVNTLLEVGKTFLANPSDAVAIARHHRLGAWPWCRLFVTDCK